MAPTTKQSALDYVAEGLSIHPVNADKSPILSSWKPYQHEIAADYEIEEWFRDYPKAGIAVICGRVSGELAVLDVDDDDFATWLREKGSRFLATTWTVETGSGKLHIYLRSNTPVLTTVVKGKTRLADLRANGIPPKEASYVVAPPSPYYKRYKDGTEITGSYRTIYGSCKTIATVSDAADIFLKVARRYDEEAILSRRWTEDLGLLEIEPITEVRIATPAQNGHAEELKELVRTSNLPGRLKKAILKGVTPGDGLFAKMPDYSTIDFYIVNQMVEKRFTRDEIRQIYATFPVGEGRYQNRTSGKTYGDSYFDITYDAVMRHQEKKRDALTKAKGENFEVLGGTKIAYELDPEYELKIALSDGQIIMVRGLTVENITHFNQFRDKMAAATGVIPHLTRDQEKDYTPLAQAMLNTLKEEAAPTDASATGYLRRTILQLLTDQTSDLPPTSAADTGLGWKSDKDGKVFFKGEVLITKINNAIRPSPAPTTVWSVVRGLRGRDEEGIWSLPLKLLEKDK